MQILQGKLLEEGLIKDAEADSFCKQFSDLQKQLDQLHLKMLGSIYDMYTWQITTGNDNSGAAYKGQEEEESQPEFDEFGMRTWLAIRRIYLDPKMLQANLNATQNGLAQAMAKSWATEVELEGNLRKASAKIFQLEQELEWREQQQHTTRR